MNHTHTRVSKVVSVVLAIVCLWGAGFSLLGVLINFAMGFNSTNTDYESAFLEMVTSNHREELENWLRISERIRQNDGKSSAARNVLKERADILARRYDPERTNLRFTFTDADGSVLLTNDQGSGSTADRLASMIAPVMLTREEEGYTVEKHFDLTSENVSLLNDAPDMGQYLQNSGDLRTWYFTDDSVDYAWHNGVSAVIRYADGDTEEADGLPLENYVRMKEHGENVTLNDAALEAALADGLNVTIQAVRAASTTYYLRTSLPADLPVQDSIRSNYRMFRLVFQYSEQLVIALFVCIALTVAACIWMCGLAGYREPGVLAPSRVHALAYEWFWILPVVTAVMSAAGMIVLAESAVSYTLIGFFGAGFSLCIAAACILWLYTTAVRVKSGTFWRSFLIVRFFRFLFGLFRSKASACIGVTLWLGFLLAVNFIGMYDRDHVLLLPAFGLDLLTLLGILYAVYAYFELHRHVERMETGDFTPAAHALPLGADFARFDRSLNEITERVGEIVAKQTKAEHLRTELITNVSHDLKTPLTSIVNYVDLLSRQEMPGAEAREYVDVLKRQAARLQKLTLDLVEASKASTGNITAELMPTDLGVLVGQISGEYEDRMAARGLSLIASLPEEPVHILADGRLIWRVFDNLLGNACKYAMEGTRVYLDLTADAENAVISLKNISATPLNISPDELMERFVRGDSSRHTEGSGLGLSIAKDLTALQNGTLSLHTDGDLFKAVLQFPRIAVSPMD